MAQFLLTVDVEGDDKQMLGIDIGSWISAVMALGGRAPAALAVHVPLLDPGPVASVLALLVASALVWHGQRRTA